MIPFAEPDLTGNERRYLLEALDSGWISKGDFITRFELKLIERFGWHAVVCSSGTAALHLALLAGGIGHGARVILPDLTFASAAHVVKHVGAELVLADVDSCGLISAAAVRELAYQGARAVMPTHLFGQQCDMRSIMATAREYGLLVIEDAAEMCRPWMIQGDFACMSFYGNKQITTGEGGAVFCKTQWSADQVRKWRDHGMTHAYWHDRAGLNYAMTNIQAAIGTAQMERYEEFRARRDVVRGRYREAGLEGFGDWVWVTPKKPMKSVETRPIFTPLHTLPHMVAPGDFPNAIEIYRNNMMLPCAPHLDHWAVGEIIREYQELARAA